MVLVHPETQIVVAMVDCVTSGLVAPGVRCGSGSTAPAALMVIPPVVSAGCGVAVVLTGVADGLVSVLVLLVVTATVGCGNEAVEVALSMPVEAFAVWCGGCPPVASETMISTESNPAPVQIVRFSRRFGVGLSRSACPIRTHTEAEPGTATSLTLAGRT